MLGGRFLGLVGRRRLDGLFTEQIAEQRRVVLASKEARQFAPQPVRQLLFGKGVLALFQPVQKEGAEKHLASRIPGPFLLTELGLKGFALGLQLGQPFGDRTLRQRILRGARPSDVKIASGKSAVTLFQQLQAGWNRRCSESQASPFSRRVRPAILMADNRISLIYISGYC